MYHFKMILDFVYKRIILSLKTIEIYINEKIKLLN